MQARIQEQRQQAIRNEYAQATGIKGTPKSREAMNLLRNWGAALAKTLKHVCTTANRVGKQIMKAAKKIDWKKVAIVATATVAAVAVTVATAGAAAGAAGGAVSSFTTSVLSGDKPKDILANTWNGAVNGFVAGGATGGLLGGF
ncbi:hypothetical protein, partial [Streptococcus suis]|uniref:hypothetical protein n=1 Tax=Streptococcus suis TaxID=1307 RepID=UPI00241019A6